MHRKVVKRTNRTKPVLAYARSTLLYPTTLPRSLSPADQTISLDRIEVGRRDISGYPPPFQEPKVRIRLPNGGSSFARRHFKSSQ